MTSIIDIKKKIFFMYNVSSIKTAGIVLKSIEVKYVKNCKIDILNSYISIKENEIFLLKFFINKNCRNIKLLLKRKEIDEIKVFLKKNSTTIIPFKLYLKGIFLKLDIALCYGKKKFHKNIKHKVFQDHYDMF